jgi:hypothetical protein
VAGAFKIQPHLLRRIVGVAVQNGVDRGFAHRHRDLQNLFLGETAFSGDFIGGLLGAVNRIEGRVQRERAPLWCHKHWFRVYATPYSQQTTLAVFRQIG